MFGFTALQELLDWLRHLDGLLVADGPVHGDLDTVMALIDSHKVINFFINVLPLINYITFN